MNPSSKHLKRQGKSKRQARKSQIPRQPVRMSGSSVTNTVESFLPVFPNTTVRKLRYNNTNVLAPASGVLDTHVFSLNGLYDPDITGAGHQPMGFDEMMYFYEHYHVIHTTVHVTFMNAQPLYRGYVGLKVTPDVTPPAQYEQYVEEGRAVSDVISGDSSSFNGTKVLTTSVNVPAINGLTRGNFLASDVYRGGITSNPAEQTYLQVGAWSPALQNLAVEFSIILEYTVAFTEPRNLTSSLALRRPNTPALPATQESKMPRVARR